MCSRGRLRIRCRGARHSGSPAALNVALPDTLLDALHFVEPSRQTILFFVENMIETHSATRIRTAVSRFDSRATLRVDLALRRVSI